MRSRTLSCTNAISKMDVRRLGIPGNNRYRAAAVCAHCGGKVYAIGIGPGAAKKFLREKVQEHIERCTGIEELKEDILVSCG